MLSLGAARQRWGAASRELALLGFGQVLTIAASLVGVRLLTGALPPRAYGELMLLLTVSTLSQLVLFGPAMNAGARFFAPAAEAHRLRGFVAALADLLGASAIVAIALTLVGAVVLRATGFSQWSFAIVLACAFALASALGETLNSVQNAARQRAVAAFHVAGVTWLRFTGAALAARWLAPTAQMAMLGYIAAVLLGLVSQTWFFRRELRRQGFPAEAREPGARRHYRMQMTAFSWPFATWGVFQWAQQSSDRWSLQRFAGPETVGIYAVVFQLGYTPLLLLSNLLNQMVSPILYSRAGDGTDARRMNDARRLNNIVVAIVAAATVPAALLAWALHARIFALLVAPQYRSGSYLLPWFVVAGGLFACGQAASIGLSIGLTTHRLIAPKIGAALIGIVLNALGAYLYGAPGVVAAMIVTATIFAVWVITLVTLDGAKSAAVESTEIHLGEPTGGALATEGIAAR